jgi:hypothetical protein
MQRDLARRFQSLEPDHHGSGERVAGLHGAIDGSGEQMLLARRAHEFRIETIGERARIALVIAIRDQHPREPTARGDIVRVGVGDRQRIDRHVAVRTRNEERIEKEIAIGLPHGPHRNAREHRLLHGAFFVSACDGAYANGCASAPSIA